MRTYFIDGADEGRDDFVTELSLTHVTQSCDTFTTQINVLSFTFQQTQLHTQTTHRQTHVVVVAVAVAVVVAAAAAAVVAVVHCVLQRKTYDYILYNK